MVNNVVLAGHYVSLKKNIMNLSITIAKENNEPYELLVPVVLSRHLLENVKEYISKGDVVGTKGYLDNKDGSLICIAEKITFLSRVKE